MKQGITLIGFLLIASLMLDAVVGMGDATDEGEKREEYVSTNSVAVIGAGISGLTAAHNLMKLGYSVTVFEADSRVGGKIESVYLEGGGLRSSDLLAQPLTPEMELKAQKLCGDRRPTELGAVAGLGDVMQNLAKEWDVPFGLGATEHKLSAVQHDDGQTVKVSPEEYLVELAREETDPCLSEVSGPNACANLREILYDTMVKKFPEIGSPRLDGNHPDLALSMAMFADKYNVSLIVETIRAQFSGYGYAYHETVPAGSMLKIMFASFVTEGYSVFPCGYQSLPEAMAATMDIRLNAEVLEIKRKEKFVEVRATGQPVSKFDHLIISTTLDLVPDFLDVEEFEADLFSRLRFNRYITTVAKAEGNEVEEGRIAEFVTYADQGYAFNMNNVNLHVVTNITSNGQLFYQIVDKEITAADAFDVLQENMQTYWQGGIVDGVVVARRDTYNYFPTVSPEDFASGFYDKMEELQGYRNTYYVGGQLSGELVPLCHEYARDLILRKFVAVSAGKED
eukprot:CAMPEP_0194027414 /NCGR_PEP_ID=MMETSP0009_2-20130614/1570_1 /TAXON_ID=210454 /ORGANISM="Grammatophora oceanica, Strain CCMP 410" /LENGTH=509 /DNA_ID=CAMNT_0038666471 /DNA_START=43 /DNA_END=1572 /DNA_ORIENTATION=-